MADRPPSFEQILDLLPTLSIDLFVTSPDAQRPLYISPFPDMSASGIDVLSHMWDFPGVLYTFSPNPAANSSIREDSSDFVLGSVAGPRLAQAAMVQLPCRVVRDASSTSHS